MNQSNGYRTDAELAIARQLGVFQEKAAKMWRGHEKEAVIALIRALDTSAVIRLQAADIRADDTASGHLPHRIMTLGAAAALRPFLARFVNNRAEFPGGPCERMSPTLRTHTSGAVDNLPTCPEWQQWSAMDSPRHHLQAPTT